MRLSTNQIFDTGSLGVTRNQGDLFKLQNQMSTGRRVLTPQDDPVAAAQALVVTQTKSMNEQFIENQGNAESQLRAVDGQLGALTELLQNVRERAVQAGNGVLTPADKQYIASELQARLDELVGLGNSTDGTGEYLFSGFQGGNRPFSIDGTTGDIGYYGDSGLRMLQVEPRRQMGTNIPGDELFMRVKTGNGTFQTATGGNFVTPGTVNQGTAKMDGGSVSDVNQWRNAMTTVPWSNPANSGDLRVVFSVTGATTTYQIYDNSVPGAPVPLLAAPAAFTPGQAIPLQKTTAVAPGTVNFGASVTVEGTPADGDSFVLSQSTNQSMFDTLQNLITALKTPVAGTTYTSTEYYNTVGRELLNIDRAIDNVVSTRAVVGTRLKDLDALGEVGADNKLQYESRLSGLQDLDYAKAISDFMRKQMQLEAAQKSFAQSSQLSLFNML